MKRCECGLWTDPDGQGTGCTGDTKRTFRQGHDARFASWLAHQQAAERQVHRGDNDPVMPVEAAATVGLRYDIEAKAARLARRKPKWPAEPQPVTATIKRGRWVIDNATIAPTGEAHYTTKDGQERTAAPGPYKVLV